MNSHQRRKKRRILNKVLRDYKRGLRGTWWYRHCSNRYNYEVEFWDDWIGVYHLRNKSHTEGLVVAYYTKFPKWPDKLSFLEPYKHPELDEYPAYKLKDRNFLLIPHESAVGVRWVEVGKWYGGEMRLTNIPFDKVYDSLTDQEKLEAVWYLDVLSGE